MSFTAIGIPCKGPVGFPDRLYSSASAAFSSKSFLSKCTHAFTSFSNLLILSIYFSHTSTEVSCASFIFEAISSTFKEKNIYHLICK